jgi:hypothetical protein
MLIKSESTANLTKALVAAKKDFGPVLRQKDNPFFKSKYADLAAAIDATEPALCANGLAVSQHNVSDGDRVGVLTLLLHESGEYLGESFTLPFAKQDAQSGTAAITYARRSAYLSVLCVAAEDDDGNTAAGRNESAKPAQSAPKSASASKAVASTKAAQPPKAEIPSEPLGKEAAQPTGEPVALKAQPSLAGSSALISATAEDTLPTEEQTQSIRNRFSLLNKDLADAGLKPSKGQPVGRKVTLYLLYRTGQDAGDKVTFQQWTKFFEEVGSYKNAEGGYTELARIISEFVEEKK